MRHLSGIIGKALLWMLILYVVTAIVVGVAAIFINPEKSSDAFFITLLMGWFMMLISFTPLSEMGYNGGQQSAMLRTVFWAWLAAGIIIGALHHGWRENQLDRARDAPDDDPDGSTIS